MGLATGFYFYGLLYFTNVAYVLGAFLLMKCCSRSTGANLIAWWGMIIMVSVSFHHYHLQEGGVKSEGLALDLIFMTNFIKLHMFAVNYDNAGKLDDPEKCKNLTTREKYFAESLRERLSFAEWLQYFFFCGSSVSGMSHEYRDFDEFINLKAGYAKIPKNRLIGHAAKRFAHMIICVVLMVVLSLNVSFDTLLTEEWTSKPFIWRAGYLIAAIHIKVLTLFIGFVSQETNFIACGQGYKPATKDEPENFNSLRVISIWSFESQISWTEAISKWNIQVHLWLKYYIMLRLMDRKKPKGQMQVGPMVVTFIVSAAWHGIQVGFFLMFFGFALCEYIVKTGERTKAAQFVTKNVPFHVYHPIKWFFQFFIGSYLVICFQMMTFERFNFVHSHFYYIGHWALPLGVILVSVLPKAKRA